jgi:hypothetical protein
MTDSATPALACTRPAAQDHHAPKAAVPPALSALSRGALHPRIRAHASAAAAESII